MADSLEDDLAIDEDFSVHSSASQDGDAIEIGSDGEDDQEGQLWDNQSVLSDNEVDDGAKQKKENISSKDQKAGNTTSLPPNENKKRKRKENEKARKAKRAEENKQAQSISIASQPKSYQADFLFSKMKKSFDKLSDMELDDLRIKEEMLHEVEFRKERSIENLPEFLNLTLPTLSISISNLSKSKSYSKSSESKNGSPIIILLTGNALRATDLARSLRSLLPSSSSSSKEDEKPSKKKSKPNNNPTSTETSTSSKSKSNLKSSSNQESSTSLTVAKLFSRHLKLKNQIEFLNTSITPLAVGTPNRISSLIENDSLKLNEMKFLVLDLSWLDSKEMNLFDTKENRDEVFKLFGCKKFRDELNSGKIKIVCW